MITFFYYFIFVFVFMTLGIAILEFFFSAIEKLFIHLEKYFFPTSELPAVILDEIEQEAHDFVWNMHRVGGEPEMGEYYRVLNYFYKKKHTEYFG